MSSPSSSSLSSFASSVILRSSDPVSSGAIRSVSSEANKDSTMRVSSGSNDEIDRTFDNPQDLVVERHKSGSNTARIHIHKVLPQTITDCQLFIKRIAGVLKEEYIDQK